jgi:hypothetical protein
METRRGFLAAAAGALSAAGVQGTVKEMNVSGDTIVVVNIDPELTKSGAVIDFDSIKKSLEAVGIHQSLVLEGCTMKVLPTGGYYFREKLGQVECEYVTKTWEELQELLRCHGKNV